MNWFFYALFSALSMTIFSLLARKLLKGKGDAQAFTFLIDFSAGFLSFFFPFLKKDIIG